MSDVKVILNKNGAELQLVGADFVRDNGITNSILLSLFTDRNIEGKAGWWGDTINNDNQIIGSRLFMIKKNSHNNRNMLREYIKEALEWIKDEGTAKEINIKILRYSSQKVEFKIIITQPDGKELNYLYVKNWSNEKENIERIDNVN